MSARTLKERVDWGGGGRGSWLRPILVVREDVDLIEVEEPLCTRCRDDAASRSQSERVSQRGFAEPSGFRAGAM